MENRAHALIAGLFTLALGAAAVFALWWFSGNREAFTTYHLVTTGSVGGLNPQAGVRFRGIAAGKVNSIRIDPDNPQIIIVSIGISADIPVTQGTRASLGYQGVTGLAFVQLDDRGTDPTPLASTEGRPARIELEPGLIDQLSDAAVEALERFKQLSNQIGKFFDHETLARFKNTLGTLESAASGVDRTFQEAPETLAAMRAFFSPENLARVSSALENLEQASGEAAPLAGEVRALLSRFDEVLGTVDGVTRAAGDSLIDATLPQLNGLLKDLTDTSSRLGRLIDEVDASPQMLIRGRGERRPGPGESGFRPE